MKKKKLCTALVFALVCLGAATAPVSAQCSADATGNGAVDANDLDGIIINYGTVGGSAFDVNGNGFVGENDYAKAQGNLGPCPVIEDVNGSGSVNIADMLVVGQNDGLNCLVDADGSGFVTSTDAYIIAASVNGSPDALPLAAADVDGNGALTFQDIVAVYSAFGRDCRMDADRDGTVEGLPGEDDFDQVCAAAGHC